MPSVNTLTSLNGLAAQLLRSGRTSEAIDVYQRSLTVSPNQPDCWYNLGYLQQQARYFKEALVSYQQALRFGVTSPEEVHLNCAVLLAEHLARADDAMREIRAALERNPRFVPALLNLGNLHEQSGDRELAYRAYRKVLDIDPINALALSRLAGLDLALDALTPLIGELERAIKRSGLTAAERADLGFGLGKALDSAGEYDRAFAAYTAANEASRLSAGPSGVRYDALAHELYIDRLIRAFPKPAPSSSGETGPTTPLFICGMFRSGSTLVEQILASHPRVTAGGEIDLLPAMARKHLVPLLRGSSGAVDGKSLEHLRSEYLGEISQRFPSAEVITDKRPDNFLNIGLIKLLFPSAKIIHTKRNAVDNCLAVFFLHLSHSMPYALSLRDIGHWYGQYEKLMKHWKSLYAEDIHDVEYDTLVTHFRPTIENLLAQCGLPWADTCQHFHQTKTIVATPSAWQVRQPLYTKSSGRWRHYERHLQDLREALDAR